MDVLELAKRLVNIPSLTNSEAEIADFLSTYLKSQKFEVRQQAIEGRRRNILALLRPNPWIMFCTHMDTVPPFFEAREDDSSLYGRGACDAKGIMASMILAAQELGQEGLMDIGLLFVVGEETDSVGAKAANALNIGSQFIIVGEPTENKMGRGHKGLVVLNVAAAGKSAHSAYPHLGESAVEKLIDVLQEIRFLDFGGDPVLGETLVNIGMIEGGVAHNVIADSAKATVSLRTGRPTDQILEKISVVAGGKVRIDVLSQSEPQALFTLPGYEAVVLPYCTDIPYLKSFGKTMLLGPGSVLVAHTGEEKVEKQQLLDAVRIYKNVARRLLAL